MKIKIGISACLTGEQVRYDRSHKRSGFCMNELAKFVEFKPFCPEVAIGMPIPRPTIRQVKHDQLIKVTRADGTGDVSDALARYGRKVANISDQLSDLSLLRKAPAAAWKE